MFRFHAKPQRTQRKTMTRIVITILFTFIVASCSTEVVYEPQQIAAGSPGAVNINTATADELEKLPSIGRKTAEAIVNHRSEHGAFRRVEHIMLVPRISERRFAELQPFIHAR
jgi:competence ComEA-like helix-hairpin-helix protein